MAATSTKELTATGASVTTVSAGSDATAPPPLEPWSAGAPTAAVVPAGQCAIGEDWTPCPLLERLWISKDTIVVTFGLADASKPLNLCTCSCVLARGGADATGEPFVRPYTPVSTNALKGAFELLVKVYDGGALSQQLATMALGATMDFKHIPFNVKRQYPFGAKHVAMIAGGSGITPCLQVATAVLAADLDVQIKLLYANQTPEDILCQEELHAIEKDPRVRVWYTVDRAPEGWKYSVG